LSVQTPEPLTFNPLERVRNDLRAERRFGPGNFPPGPRTFNLRRTQRFAADPLAFLLEMEHEHGPVFGVRLLHATTIFMLGPKANHFITVSDADKFRWRQGSFGDLVPLLGDGMLTIDGDYHRRARKVMLPAFHRDHLVTTVDVMLEEAVAATDALTPGTRLDVYHWTRALAMRIAMRALFGFDPDRAGRGGFDIAEEFETALGFYGRDYLLQILRGPRTPWAAMHRARRHIDRVVYEEIARRRGTGELGDDVLSLLMAASDEDGWGFDDGELRDQVMTLLFAGHDTTTSTIAFLFYELARHPAALAKLLEEQDRVLDGRPPTPAELMGGALPELEMALEETLRIYPPAWVGPRRAIEAFDFDGYRIPAGAPVNYVSWASHHLSWVFPEPHAFRPERFTPEAKAALPKGAYVPFGGGSRICLGMRFGQLEIRAIATLLLQCVHLSLAPGYRMSIRQMPTLSPRGGLPMDVASRGVPPVVALAS